MAVRRGEEATWSVGRRGGAVPSGEKIQGPFCENAAAQAQLISEIIKKESEDRRRRRWPFGYWAPGGDHLNLVPPRPDQVALIRQFPARI
jgi:hypothetical protein